MHVVSFAGLLAAWAKVWLAREAPVDYAQVIAVAGGDVAALPAGAGLGYPAHGGAALGQAQIMEIEIRDDLMRDAPRPIGAQLRAWRRRRGLSQLELAGRADSSARHLSFVETGRAQPGRGLILRVAEELEIPLRDRNALLRAAGFAPPFAQRSFDHPSFDAVRGIIDLALEAHKPFPAFVIDRHWNVIRSNAAIPELYEGVAADLLRPPMNAIRLSLHPRGLAARILNLAEWRAHLLAQLRRQAHLTADPAIEQLLREARSFPGPASAEAAPPSGDEVAIPLEIMTRLGRLCFLGTTTVFGTPVDVTLEGIALEMLYPASAATAAAVQRSAGPPLSAPR